MMSRVSSPLLALGACLCVLVLIFLHPEASELPSASVGAHISCSPGRRPVDGLCLSEQTTERFATSAVGEYARSTAPAASQRPVTALTQPEMCHTIAEGSLRQAPIVGNADASHVYVSYRLPGDTEHDVVLPGGVWRTDAPISAGRFWIYAGCTDEEIAKTVAVRRIAVNRDEPGAHAGQGDARLFHYVTGTTLGPPVVQKLD